MNTNTSSEYIYFVDHTLPDGTFEEGSVGGPLETARLYAEELRKEHPEWSVEISRTEKVSL